MASVAKRAINRAASALTEARAKARASLRKRWPNTSPDDIDDAISDAAESFLVGWTEDQDPAAVLINLAHHELLDRTRTTARRSALLEKAERVAVGKARDARSETTVQLSAAKKKKRKARLPAGYVSDNAGALRPLAGERGAEWIVQETINEQTFRMIELLLAAMEPLRDAATDCQTADHVSVPRELLNRARAAFEAFYGTPWREFRWVAEARAIATALERAHRLRAKRRPSAAVAREIVIPSWVTNDDIEELLSSTSLGGGGQSGKKYIETAVFEFVNKRRAVEHVRKWKRIAESGLSSRRTNSRT